MARRCLGGCNKWISDNRLFCISCELTYAGECIYGGEGNGEETSGNPDDSGDETSE